MCKTATSLNVWKERIMSTFARGRCMSKTATSVNAWKERVWQRLAEVAACVAAKYIYKERIWSMFVIRSHHGSQFGNFELLKMIQCSITMIVSMITCILDVWKGSLDVQSSRKERILWTVVSGRCMCKAATSLIVWKDRVMSTAEFRTVHMQSVALSITTANPNLNSYQPQEFRTFAHMQPVALSIATASESRSQSLGTV